jgi:2,4-dienoyl-CoA reductase-like NADH-dependent reductase (Old Yellow Enzyme family)
MAKSKYSKLFQPIDIGNVEIKNRIAMAPMAIAGLTTADGVSHFHRRYLDNLNSTTSPSFKPRVLRK